MQYPVIIRSHDPLVFLETGTGGPPQAVRLSQVDDSVLDWLIELGADKLGRLANVDCIVGRRVTTCPQCAVF